MQKILTTFVILASLLAVGSALDCLAADADATLTQGPLQNHCTTGVSVAGFTGHLAVCNCTVGATGYYPVNTATTPTASTNGADNKVCSVGCADCAAGNTDANQIDCISCSTGYGHPVADTTPNYVCSQCTAASNCGTCDTTSPATSAVCTGCAAGRYLNSTTKTCLACGTGCAVCTDNTSCTTCTQANLTWSNDSLKCFGSSFKTSTIIGGVIATIVLALIF